MLYVHIFIYRDYYILYTQGVSCVSIVYIHYCITTSTLKMFSTMNMLFWYLFVSVGLTIYRMYCIIRIFNVHCTHIISYSSYCTVVSYVIQLTYVSVVWTPRIELIQPHGCPAACVTFRFRAFTLVEVNPNAPPTPPRLLLSPFLSCHLTASRCLQSAFALSLSLMYTQLIFNSP